MDEKDKGFTLVELLVVMIIIGILAAIAIPVFMSQRAKARDTSTKADVSTAGKEIATYYVDGTGELTATVDPKTQILTIKDSVSDGYAAEIKLSTGTSATGGVVYSGTPSDMNWCIDLTNEAGKLKTFSYAAQDGLQPKACTKPTT